MMACDNQYYLGFSVTTGEGFGKYDPNDDCQWSDINFYAKLQSSIAVRDFDINSADWRKPWTLEMKEVYKKAFKKAKEEFKDKI